LPYSCFPTAPAQADITRILSVGSTGADVTTLQQFLNGKGYLNANPTGYFGLLTAAAVKQLQAANGLDMVGFLGPRTRALINSLLATTPTQTNSSAAKDYGDGDLADLFEAGTLTIPPTDVPVTAASFSVKKDTSILGDQGAAVILAKDTTGMSDNTGSTVDVTTLSIHSLDVTSVTPPDKNFVLAGVLQWGTPGKGLKFTKPFIVKVPIKSTFNGDTLEIYRQEDFSDPWTQEGILTPTCVAQNSICQFTATHASRFAVGKKKPDVSLTANPTTVSYGGSTVLTWASTRATTCTATGGWSGTKVGSGSETISNLTANQTFTLTCTNTGGSTAAIAAVTVTGTAPDTSAPTAPSNLAGTAAGQTQIDLTWSASTDNVGVTGYRVYRNGTQVGMLTSTTYSDNGLTAGTSYSYTVNAVDAASNVSGPSNTVSVATQAPPAPTLTFSASPTSITIGQSSTLTWSSTNATSCTGNGFTPGNTSGTQLVSPTVSTTYSVTCSGAGGALTMSATVTVSAVPTPTVSLSASPTSITAGQSSTLTWSSTNATSCTASNGWTGSKAIGNSEVVTPTATTTYTLTCTGAGGTSAPQSTTVTVTSVTPPSTKFTIGQQVTPTATVNVRSTPAGTLLGTQAAGAVATVVGGPTSAVLSGVTYIWWNLDFTSGVDGWTGEDNLAAYTAPPPSPPTVTISASPTSITAGQSSTLTWSSTNATSCTASNGWTGSKAIGSTQIVTPTVTTTYTLTCTSSTGSTATQSATVNVSVASVGCDLNATPSNFATQVSAASAGQTICLASGSYGTWTGTNKAITIKAASGAAPVMQVDLSSGDTGFTLDGMTGMGGYIGSGANNITIRNSAFTAPLTVDNPINANLLIDHNTSFNVDVSSDCKSIPAHFYISGSGSTNSGVTISNNVISGGNADGVRPDTPGTQVLNNEISNVYEKGPTDCAHSDAIQFYGGYNVTLRGNWIHNTADGIVAYDGTSGNIIEDNVVDLVNGRWGIELYSDKNSIVRHNTLVVRSTCEYYPCGWVSLDHKATDPAGVGTQVYDNLGYVVSLGNGSTAARNDHNMLVSGGTGTNFTGNATFVGGTNPTSYAGYALASNSGGKSASSDGLDVGARISGAPAQVTPAPTVSISANPTSITAGQSSTLTWSSTNATSCTASNGWTGSKAVGSTQIVTPTVTTTYTLTCTGAGGTSAPQSATVTIAAMTPSTPPSTKFTIGQQVTPTATVNVRSTPAGTALGTQLTGAVATVTGGPTAAVLNGVNVNWWNLDFTSGVDGWVGEDNLVISSAQPPTAPTVSLQASPTSITAGQSSTLTWSSTNTTSCTASGGWTGTKATGNSEVVTPTVTTTYTLTCTGAGGTSAPQSATVTVSAVTPPPTGTSYSIFTTQTPLSTNATDGATANYEMGTKFQSSVAGQITAIRFYKAPSESGTHTGRIWSSTGTQLASVVFANETASGWQTATLATPLAITAGTPYAVTVNTGNAYFVATNSGLANAVTSGPLSTIVGANGIYGPVGAYPTTSYQGSNYFRDVVLVSSAAIPPSPPTVTISASPTSITAGQSSTLTWSSTNATSCTASNGWTGSKAIGSTQIVTPTVTTTYTLTCTSSTGSTATQSATVNVSVASVGCDLNATPSNFATQVSAASAGQTICLASGSYGTWTGTNKAITIKAASGASPQMQYNFTTGDSGFTLDGMTNMSGSITYGANNITVKNSTFTSYATFDQLTNSNIVFDHNTHNNIDSPVGAPNARLSFGWGSATPSGVTIQNSLLQGGDSDGVHTGVALNVINNEFADICQGVDVNHTDEMQFEGSIGGVVRGNYFHGTACSENQALTSFDSGTVGVLIEDNVIDSPRPWGLEYYSDKNSIIRHNTIVYHPDAQCEYNNLECGQIDIEHKPVNPPTSGTQIYDNLVTSINLSDATGVRNDHNMYRSGAPSGNTTGTPIYVGGSNPTTYAGFALASNSPGKGAASDGTDVGARISGAPAPVTPAPTVTISANPISITAGQSSTLTWSSTNTTSCTASNGWTGSKAIGSTQIVTPTVTTIYTLTCTSSNGSTATQSATVTVAATTPSTPPTAGTPYSIFTTQTPTITNASDGVSTNYELGTKFQSNTAGTITAIKFYKGASESGTHTGRIWSAAGTQLASVVFSGESASGWQTATLATPLAVSANTTYVVTVNSGNSYYVASNNLLATAITNGPLSTIVGSNGVYGSVGAFPTTSYLNTSYFRDVVFVPSSGAYGGSNTLVASPVYALPQGIFASGGTVHTTANLNVRISPNGALVGTENAGATGVVSGAPVQSGGYTWWMVEYSDGKSGWSAENFLAR
jgi:hypothetical protein